MPPGEWLRLRAERLRDGVTAWLSPWPVGALRVLIVIGLIALAGYGVERGIALRRWTWDFTESFRFCGDINRGFTYGKRAVNEGFIDLYARREAEAAHGGKNDLNYAPLRLATMTWYAWVISDPRKYPDATMWQRDPYEFTAPVLRVNMAMELAASLAAFVLVILWMRRASSERAGPSGPGAGPASKSRWTWTTDIVSPFRCWITATIAASLIWFNPASLVNAHGWPLWDIWVVPFFLWALVCISLDRWLIAGVIIGVGTMFKGQQMLVAPLFILTPLFMGRPAAALRWTAGLVLGLGIVVLPWMLTYPLEPVIIEGTHQAAMRDPAAALWNTTAIAWVGSVAVTFTLLAIAGRFCRWIPANAAVVAAATGLAIFACIPLFGASLAWLRVGLLHGTEVFPTLYVAHAYNIPALLDQQFGFNNKTDLQHILFTLHGHDVSLKQLMAAIYFVTLVLCSIGAARHWRRNDPRTLVALIAPWLLMFTIVTQMHERYLLFTAAMSATLIVVRWPYILMCALLSFLAMCMTADTMIGATRWHLDTWPLEPPRLDREQLRTLGESVRSIFPGAAWAVVACCIVMLVDALGLGGVRLARQRSVPK